jgi:uncharacterized protein
VLATSLSLMGDLASLTGRPGLRHHVLGLAEPTSVREALASLGVPHTEVDLVLLGGLPVGFGHRVRDADRFEVHPVPTAAEDAAGRLAWPEGRLQPRPLGRERFVCDRHLGRLARLLRLLGFDTLYDDAWTEAQIAQAAADGRAVLTCGRALLKRRAVTVGRLLRARDTDQQALEVIRRFGLSGRERPFARCNRCNGELRPVPKTTVAVRVPLRTRAWCDDYFLCAGCDHLYWRGTHVARMQEHFAALFEGSKEEA